VITSEVDSFADSIRAIVSDHPTPDPWSPAFVGDDVVPALHDRLAAVGWDSLADGEESATFAGRVAIELGRGLVAVREIDALLGGSPCTSGLARYAKPAGIAVLPLPDRLRRVRIASIEPVPYADAQGVARVTYEDDGPIDPIEASLRENTWVSASIGYLAGLTAGAVQLALDHAKMRKAFGATLASLPSVQQRLADAALCSDGLAMLAEGPADFDALTDAGAAAYSAVAQCHQVVGAIGYTLEFPLQRYSRRARALQLWADAWIDARL